MNVERSALYGRSEEIYSECPFMTGRLGARYIRGIQRGEDPRYLKIAACAKHFAVHDGPDAERETFTAARPLFFLAVVVHRETFFFVGCGHVLALRYVFACV